jgi:hypothetical protein
MKPRLFSLLLLSGAALLPVARACEVCAAQQPKLLRGLTHGAGPQGSFDYVIVLAAVAVVLFTLVYAIKFLVRPGEREASHIKRIVLNQDYHGI